MPPWGLLQWLGALRMVGDAKENGAIDNNIAEAGFILKDLPQCVFCSLSVVLFSDPSPAVPQVEPIGGCKDTSTREKQVEGLSAGASIVAW